jgi:hypothetical protein
MVERARRDVWVELRRAGLATPALASVKIVRPWLQLNERVGSYTPGGGGTIAVPAVTLGRLAEYRRQATWTGVRDVLRHEYAHALADLHPSLVARERFARVFGAAHEHPVSAGGYAFTAHVSEYAATTPGEDFAETVMLFLRCSGEIEGYADRPALMRKLRYVAELPRWLRDEDLDEARLQRAG